MASTSIDNMEIDHNEDFVSLQEPSISSWKEDQNFQRAAREVGECAAQHEDDFADLEYWFGSIYFQCLLAQDVFDRVTPGCSFLTADSLLSSRIRRFAFRDALAVCKEQGFSSNLSDVYTRQDEHSTALMVLIGNVVRTRPREDMRDMLRLLRESVGSRQGLQPCDLPSTDENTKSTTIADVPMNQMPLSVPRHGADDWKYTSILKEKGDVAGFVPAYNFKQVLSTPSLFKAVVSFQDYVFEGSGRTKQHAKHAASREACIALGLEE